MKNLIFKVMLIVSALFALPFIGVDASSANAQQKYVTITGNGVRLRRGPSLNADIITQKNKGTRLPLNYVTSDGDWYCVTYNGQNAFVSRDFASLASGSSSKSSSSSASSKSYTKCVVNAHNLRLRVGPGTNYSYLIWTDTGATIYLNHGEVLPYLGETQNGFCKVRYANTVCWVSKKYVVMK